MAIQNLIDEWSQMSPADWSQDRYGWLDGGRPITLVTWQQAILDEFWARRDLVSTLFISTVKKAGKTLTASIVLCHRWLTMPGLHFVVNCDQQQGELLQTSMIGIMVTNHPILKKFCKVNKNELLFKPTGSRLITLAADFAGSAGHNFLSASFSEIWASVYEADVRLFEELTPPPLTNALRVLDSYAGFLNESNLLRGIWDRAEAGEVVSPDWPITLNGQQLSFLYTGSSAQCRCWRGTDTQRESYYAEQQATLRPATYARLHLNQWAQAENAFIDPAAWQALFNPALSPLEPYSPQPLYLGLDLATAVNGDNAALAGVIAEDGLVKLALHKIWAGRERVEKLKLSETVKPFILRLKREFNLIGVWGDPYQALLLFEELRLAGIKCHEVSQSHSGRGPMDSALYEAILAKKLMLYPHPDLTNAAANATATELPDGRIFLKKANARAKIDILIALSLACWPARRAANRPQRQPRSHDGFSSSPHEQKIILTTHRTGLPTTSDESGPGFITEIMGDMALCKTREDLLRMREAYPKIFALFEIQYPHRARLAKGKP